MLNTSPPQYLYKYRCVDANALSMLATNQLYLSRIEAFNDPFEFLDPLSTYYASREVDPIVTYARLDSESRENPTHASMRVCALNEDCQNVLMWGHYTDCHRGFCIKFDFNNDETLRKKLFGMNYTSEFPDHSTQSTSLEPYFPGLTKSDYWKYEKEWRIIGHVPEQQATFYEMFLPYQSSSIVGIIFGLRTPELHKKLIRKVLQGNSSVKYYQAFKQHNGFAMAVRELND